MSVMAFFALSFFREITINRSYHALRWVAFTQRGWNLKCNKHFHRRWFLTTSWRRRRKWEKKLEKERATGEWKSKSEREREREERIHTKWTVCKGICLTQCNWQNLKVNLAIRFSLFFLVNREYSQMCHTVNTIDFFITLVDLPQGTTCTLVTGHRYE